MPKDHDPDQQRKDIPSTVPLLWSTALAADPLPKQTLRVAHDKTALHGHELVVRSKSVRQPNESQDLNADYELGSLLGEGGMGLVYDARQAAVDRRVAVKMLKPNINANDRLRDQFLHEAVVTGELDHPNIVPIYDLGSTEEGVLFYAMKQVRGTLWSDVIRENPQAENLDILLRVCDAIAFAHSRNIMHRDLKPENIKLGDFGEVYVLDWGLAMSCAELPEGRFLPASVLGGTPAYMAPEMTVGPLERIGSASDIYLLGGILFEILTGQPPHDGATATECLVAAGTNRITETDQTGELIEIAWKAMSTKPEDRHHSIKHFQESIGDYQQHRQSNVLVQQANETLAKAVSEDTYEEFSEAIFGFQQALSLWPDNQSAAIGLDESQVKFAQSAWRRGDFELALSQLEQNDPSHAEMIQTIQQERQQRESQRRRLTVIRRTAAALVLILCVLLSAALIWVTDAERRAIRQGEIAFQQFERAEQNYLRARLAVDQMLTEVGEDDLKNVPHMELARKRLLERALGFYKTFLTEEPKDALIQVETARAYQRVAQITKLLGHIDEQQEAYRKSIELYRQLVQDDSKNQRDYQYQVALNFNELGESFRAAGQTNKAEEAYNQARETQQQLHSQDFSDAPLQRELARTTYNLALICFETNRFEQAGEFYQQSIGLLEPLLAASPAKKEYLHQLARVLLNRGNLLNQEEETVAAEADYRHAIELLKQILHQSPQEREIQYELAVLYGNLGNALRRLPDRRSEAVKVYQDSIQSFEQLTGDFPQLPLYRRGWANSLNSLAALYFADNNHGEARGKWRQALEIYRPLVTVHADVPDFQSEYGSALGNLGYFLIDEDKTAALEMLSEAIEYQQRAAKSNPQHPGYRAALANHFRSLVGGYLKWNQHQQAVEIANRLLEIAPHDWQSSYYTARHVLRCLDQLENDETLTADKRAMLREGYQLLALNLLQAAVAKGFVDVEALQTDSLFQPLRQQPAFMTLVKALKNP